MKCNPWRWLWGLPLLAMLAWIMILGERPRIEKELAKATETALSSAGLDWARASFEGRDATISGRAFSETGARDVVDIARRVPGVRVAQSRVDLADKVSPFTWGASHKSGKVKLSGHVPDEKNRIAIVAAAKSAFPNANVEDKLLVARGAPDRKTWKGGVEFALAQLAAMTYGEASLSDTDFSISGETPDFATYKSVKQAVGAGLPNGIKLAETSITPPRVTPFTWSARRTTSQILLAGHVPNEKLRDEFFALVKKRFPEAAIVDRTEVARGAPDGFAKAARACIVSGLAQMQAGSCDLSANRIKVTGEAADKAGAASIIASLTTDAPAFKVEDKLTYPDPKPPAVSPYVTKVERTGSVVELSGYAPNAEQRAALIELAKKAYPDRSILNRLELGSGEPEGWRACIEAGISSMPELRSAKLALTGRQLTLTGAANDEALADRIPSQLRAGANRACKTEAIVTLDVAPEPRLEWRADRAPAGDIVLSGSVPNEQARTLILDQAKALFPNAKIEDRMSVAGVASRKWSQVAVSGLKMLARLRSGTAQISDYRLTLLGDAPDTAVFGALKDRLARGFAGGFDGQHDLKVRSDAMIWAEQEAAKKAEQKRLAEEAANKRKAELDEQARLKAEDEARKKREAAEVEAKAKADAAEAERLAKERAVEAERQARLAARKEEATKCQDLLMSAAAKGVIRFQTARFELRQSSRPTIRRLAEIANQCPGFNIVIEGHTDSQGTDENNLALSQKRAQSVVDYLIESGVESDRLKAIGYGESRPLVPNSNRRNMARNRRIEFKVLVN